MVTAKVPRGACLDGPSSRNPRLLLIPYAPPRDAAFRATPLDVTDWLLVGLVAGLPAVAAEVVRWRGNGRAIWVA